MHIGFTGEKVFDGGGSGMAGEWHCGDGCLAVEWQGARSNLWEDISYWEE
jgi:hypothetical protein